MVAEMHCKVMIMAGGTGGHVFPALAVADELRAADVGVSWLGTRAGIEAELVPANGIKLNYLDIEGIRGRGLLALLKAPLLLWRSIRQSLSVLSEYQPQVVLGMGGFASGPGAVAARLKGIPLVIHEQNSVAGTTNRISARLARRVMQGFPGVFKRGEWCGNPVRPSIAKMPTPDVRFAKRTGAVGNRMAEGIQINNGLFSYAAPLSRCYIIGIGQECGHSAGADWIIDRIAESLAHRGLGAATPLEKIEDMFSVSEVTRRRANKVCFFSCVFLTPVLMVLLLVSAPRY